MFKPTLAIQLLTTVPEIGLTLAVVIALEIGDVTRFPTPRSSPATLGAPAASTRAVTRCATGASAPTSSAASNGAFIEAANAICLMHRRHPHRHVSRLYERTGHPKAIGTVARHLAEAPYWVLSKQEAYLESQSSAVSSTGESATSP